MRDPAGILRELRAGGAVTYPAGARLPRRRMLDYEFVGILRGQTAYQRGSALYPAPPGSMILSRPGVWESYVWDPANATSHIYFHFDLRRIPQDLPSPHRWPILLAVPTNDILWRLFQFVLDYVPNRGSPPVLLDRAVELMLRLYVMRPPAGELWRGQPLPRRVRESLAWLQRRAREQPSRPLRLADIAAAVSVDERHLCRLFQQALRASPMRIWTALRLAHAVRMMERTDLKFEVIARSCGFSSPYHFSRRMRAYYGAPPRQIRAGLALGVRPRSPVLLPPELLSGP